MIKKIPTKTYWYIPDYCRFAIPVKIIGVCEGFGEYNDLVDIDEPVGNYISKEVLFDSIKDVRLVLILLKKEDKLQEIHNNHKERIFGIRKYKNCYHILRKWRNLKIIGIVSTWPEEYRDELSLKDYKPKKVYRIK